MKNLYAKDVNLETKISEDLFVLIEAKRYQAKNGSPYIRLLLADKTGTLRGNIWENNIANCDEEILKPGIIVKIWAKVEDFQGKLQLNITSIGKASEYNEEDFIEISARNLDVMRKELEKHIQSIEDEALKDFMNYILSLEEIKDKFYTHPAANKIHHGYQSGLLEHILEMLDMSDALLKYYPQANKSLVKAGIILHDIGKLDEIINEKIVIEKSVEGRLLGHITLGYELLLKYGEKALPKNTLLKLKHILLSHHGSLEFGSPVVPMIIEAIIVHQLDDTSAKTRIYSRILQENEGKSTPFSEKDYILDTMVYLE